MNATPCRHSHGILIIHENSFVGRNLQHIVHKLGFWNIATRSPLEAAKILRKHRFEIQGALFAIHPNRRIGPRLIRELRLLNPTLALGFIDLHGHRRAFEYLRTQGAVLEAPLLGSLRAFLASLASDPMLNCESHGLVSLLNKEKRA